MKSVVQYKVGSLEEMQRIAKDFALDFISSMTADQTTALVIGLYGELGAGKTTFVQGLARALGIEDRLVSPTFVIEKIYELPELNALETKGLTHLIHIDAYRLEKSEELLRLGWQEIIADPKNIIVIEWPERVENIMPKHIKIKFTHVSENEREIEVMGVKMLQ